MDRSDTDFKPWAVYIPKNRAPREYSAPPSVEVACSRPKDASETDFIFPLEIWAHICGYETSGEGLIRLSSSCHYFHRTLDGKVRRDRFTVNILKLSYCGYEVNQVRVLKGSSIGSLSSIHKICPMLQVLDLSFCLTLKAADFKPIWKLTRLRRLYVNCTKYIPGSSWESGPLTLFHANRTGIRIQDLKHFTSLTDLSLASRDTKKETPIGEASLKFFPSLKFLNLSKSKIQGDMIDVEMSHLSHLYLKGCSLDDTFLKRLSKFQTLSCLDLSQNNQITWEGLNAVLTQLPALFTLSLKYCLGIDFGTASQKMVESNPEVTFQLRHLNLSGCSLTLDAFKDFIQFFKSLDTLNLSNCGELLTADWRQHVPGALI